MPSAAAPAHGAGLDGGRFDGCDYFVARLRRRRAWPAILPLAIRIGLKPMVVVGALALAAQYPILAEVDGIGPWLLALCIVTAIGEVIYWPCYNAYFAALGDHEHRGHQASAREALVSVVSVVAPLLGTWALVTLGPRPMFASVALVQALAAVPLLGTPWLAIAANALGGFAMPLLLPPLGAAVYNLAKAAPCPLRFQITAEAGWDLGCIAGCLVAAALAAAGVSLTPAILLALPGMAVAARALWKYYPENANLPSSDQAAAKSERT